MRQAQLRIRVVAIVRDSWVMVFVHEEADGRLVIAFMDPVAVLQMTGNPKVGCVAQEVCARLQRAKSELG